MDTLVEIPEVELEALQRVVQLGDELCGALCRSQDVAIVGSDFELQFVAFLRALGRSPEHCEQGKYIWKEIEEDMRFDSRGG